MPLRRTWQAVGQDMRDAIRALRATPATTLFIVGTLALGIGAVATMFGFVNRLFFQPPPHVVDPDRVARLFFHYDEPGAPRATRSQWFACVHDRLRGEVTSIEQAAGYSRFQVSIGAGADAAAARAVVVSSGFWAALGPRPAVGRFFADREAMPAASSRLVILGHGFWQERYGGDRDVIGRTLRVRGETFEIIGVTPRGFRGIELEDVDLWLPLSGYTLTGRRWEPDTELSHVVRLREGVTVQRADADMSRVLADVVDDRLGCDRPAGATPPAARLSVSAGPLGAGVGSDMSPTADARVVIWLVGVAALLLAVACANVAGLLLLRALHRRREVAVRLALGMSRRRLAARFFIESAMLAMLGGVAACAVVAWGGEWISRVLLPNAGWNPGDFIDLTVIVFAAGCVLATTLLAGFVPLLQVRADPVLALQHASRTTSRRGRLHTALLVSQVALSAVLLVGAGLFLRSLHNIRGLDLGLEPEDVVVVNVDFAGTGRSPREVAAFYERALERVRSLPGIQQASLATSIPLRSARAKSIRPLTRAESITAPSGDATYGNAVTPGFFATAGTRIIEGRDFFPRERDAAAVVIVNDALARVGWAGRSPIGDCVVIDDRQACATVVGVVANARRFFLREPAALLFYEPLRRDDEELARGALFVRVAPGAREAVATVTHTMQTLAADLPFVRVRRLADALDPQTRPWRLGAAVFTLFGSLAALLAAIGLYGALSSAVSQRRREIGIRIAVGAGVADVLGLIGGQGLGVAVMGIAAGLAISLASGKWIAELLFDVSPRDPLVFIAVAGLIVGVAVASAIVPAWRATRVDPVAALRAEP